MPINPLDGRPLSDLNNVADLRDDDFFDLYRPSEPDPKDQNAIIRADRVRALLGGGTGTPGTPSTLPLYGGAGTHTDGPMTQAAATTYGNRAPNRRPDLSKQARFLTAAEAGAGGGVTLEQLLTRPDFLCLGTRITVELDPAGPNTVYIVVYDGQTRAAGSPGLIVFRDGDFTANDFVPAKVARLDSPEAATRAYPSFPAGYVFNADQLIRAFVYGNTTELFFSRKAPGGAAPAPSAVGGDANWLRVGAQDVPRSATFQAITVNQYGTHPAFANQTALNAYLLGGTTPAPAESVTITSVTPS